MKLLFLCHFKLFMSPVLVWIFCMRVPRFRPVSGRFFSMLSVKSQLPGSPSSLTFSFVVVVVVLPMNQPHREHASHPAERRRLKAPSGSKKSKLTSVSVLLLKPELGRMDQILQFVPFRGWLEDSEGRTEVHAINSKAQCLFNGLWNLLVHVY